MERIRFVIDKKTDGQMDEQTDKYENNYLFSLEEVGDLKQASIYVFEETSLEVYIVFNFLTIRPSAYLSFSTSFCVLTFS